MDTPQSEMVETPAKRTSGSSSKDGPQSAAPAPPARLPADPSVSNLRTEIIFIFN
jgi:hypothetical protein